MRKIVSKNKIVVVLKEKNVLSLVTLINLKDHQIETHSTWAYKEILLIIRAKKNVVQLANSGGIFICLTVK